MFALLQLQAKGVYFVLANIHVSKTLDPAVFLYDSGFCDPALPGVSGALQVSRGAPTRVLRATDREGVKNSRNTMDMWFGGHRPEITSVHRVVVVTGADAGK